MIIGPKYKICKRLGASVFEKCQTAKYQLAEARAPRRTGRPGRGGGGDFGVQLLEKQKARFTYGLSESQFARYVHEAMDKKGADSKSALMVRLESRLDNTVYRAGFVKTRRAARQLVSHGHVMVNGRRMTIPSYKVEIGDVVSIRPESRPSPLFVGRQEAAAEHKAPVWMTTGDEGFSVTVNATPSVGDVAPFNAATIIQRLSL
jgi:small subunit ribosomal protein S4